MVLTETGPYLGPVLVSRSPSYSPGDLRALTAVAPPPDSPVGELRSCILFCTAGARADPDKMSGDDLDGDLYLVVWDVRILARYHARIRAEPAASYAPPARDAAVRLPDEDWLRYIARWDNAMLGRIDRCFFRLAHEKGIRSRECAQLCELFLRAVDQHASDLAVLAQLEAVCGADDGALRPVPPQPAAEGGDGVDAILGGPFAAQLSPLPLWDRMHQQQLAVVEWIRACHGPQENRRRWKTFYQRLCGCAPVNHHRIERLWGEDAGVRNNIPAAKVAHCRRRWLRLVQDAHYSRSQRQTRDGSDRNSWGRAGNGWEESRSSPSPVENLKTVPQEEITAFLAQLQADALREFHPEIAETSVAIERCEQTVTKEQARLSRTLAQLEAPRAVAQRRLSEFNAALGRLEKQRQAALTALTDKISELTSAWNHARRLNLELEGQKFDSMGAWKFVGQLLLDLPPALGRRICFFCWPRVESSLGELVQLQSDTAALARQRDAGTQALTRRAHDFEAAERQLDESMGKRELLAELLQLQQRHRELLSGELWRRTEIQTAVQRAVLDRAETEREDAADALAACEDQMGRLKTRIATDQRCNLKGAEVRRLQELETELAALPRFGGCQEKDALRRDIRVAKELSGAQREAKKGLDAAQEAWEAAARLSVKTQSAVAEAWRQLMQLEKELEETYSPERLGTAETQLAESLGVLQGCELALSGIAQNCEDVRQEESLSESAWPRRKLELQISLRREVRRLCPKPGEGKDSRLPVYAKRAEVMRALADHDALVITAGTGCGKSTQLPQYLLDDLRQVMDTFCNSNRPSARHSDGSTPGSDQNRGGARGFPRVVCTQPRRLAASPPRTSRSGWRWSTAPTRAPGSRSCCPWPPRPTASALRWTQAAGWASRWGATGRRFGGTSPTPTAGPHGRRDWPLSPRGRC